MQADNPRHPGFFDLPPDQTCRHAEHDFPTGLYIPAGQGYTHVCPACGKTQTQCVQPLWMKQGKSHD